MTRFDNNDNTNLLLMFLINGLLFHFISGLLHAYQVDRTTDDLASAVIWRDIRMHRKKVSPTVLALMTSAFETRSSPAKV